MTAQMTLRSTTPRDLAAIDRLLAESYPALLKADYPPSVMVTALPLISRARPDLLRSGRYYMVEEDGKPGCALAAGGWSLSPPQGGPGPADVGHIRHVATHPSVTRRGLARLVLDRCLADARAAGVTWMMCQSTRTAVPFYRAMGFEDRGETDITLRPGITFPAVEMARVL